MNPTVTLLLGICFGAVIGLVVALIWRIRFAAGIRRDAVLRSQAVTAGRITEQLVPYLPGFPFNPKDVRFLGSPVDLIVFDGLDAGEPRRIVFVEVKTGSATLSPRERKVRDVIRDGRVAWEELRINLG
jgi:predicted Holliday junction resolvase-like endonuclease